MPNHIHLIFKPLEKQPGGFYSLTEILHSLKRFTTRRSNQILGCTGTFWRHESYDYVIRNDNEHKRIIDYAFNNPVQAGLVPDWREWEWTFTRS